MENFTTLAYLLSFPGMIAAVIMLTQWTKKMIDDIKPMPTKYVVYFYALSFCIVAGIFQGNISNVSAALETIIVWFVNSIIVWLAAMKAFETVLTKKEI